jgi:hypothetical protein
LTVQQRNRLLPTAALVLAVLVAAATFAVVESVSNIKGFSNQGKLKAVDLGLYSDNACTNETNGVNWGSFSPGASSSVTLYVRNQGDSAVKLNLTTQNWNPANARELITLTWNREGQVLKPQMVTVATLSLSVSANVNGITDFSFDTIVTAE